MKEWLEYACVVDACSRWRSFCRVPLARALGAGLREILFALTPKLRKTAEFNLKLAFPEWSPTRSGRRRFAEWCAILDGWRPSSRACPGYTRENIEDIIVLDGNENFLEGQRRGKGVLFLDSAHGRLGVVFLCARAVRLSAALHGAAARQSAPRMRW